MNIKLVNPSDLVIGDTVLVNGNMVTVGADTVKNSFFGTTISGDRITGKRKAKFSANFNYPTDNRVVNTTQTNGGTVGLVGNLLMVVKVYRNLK